jgi:hypothetical protein
LPWFQSRAVEEWYRQHPHNKVGDGRCAGLAQQRCRFRPTVMMAFEKVPVAPKRSTTVM